jgi:hypothetical protein
MSYSERNALSFLRASTRIGNEILMEPFLPLITSRNDRVSKVALVGWAVSIPEWV